MDTKETQIRTSGKTEGIKTLLGQPCCPELVDGSNFRGGLMRDWHVTLLDMAIYTTLEKLFDRGKYT